MRKGIEGTSYSFVNQAAPAEGSVAQVGLALLFPVALVGDGQCIEIVWGPVAVDPLAQFGTAVDDVDGELAELIFVGEIAPQIVVGLKPPDRLEGQRLQPPRLELS